jgi:hypothetical protein
MDRPGCVCVRKETKREGGKKKSVRGGRQRDKEYMKLAENFEPS